MHRMRIKFDPTHQKFLAQTDHGFSKSALTKAGWIKLSNKIFYTSDIYAVEKFKDHVDIECKGRLNRKLTWWKDSFRDSYRKCPILPGRLEKPNGFKYMDYQKHGIRHAIKQFNNGYRGVLIADEMGLGKTIQGIGIINNKPDINSVLIVCPASLKFMWRDALEEWMTKFYFVGVAGSKEGFPDTEIVIINYDILMRYRKQFMSRDWDLTILDESHYVKNPKAQRTKAILGGGGFKIINSRHLLFLTGTPILNRPVELWTTLKACDPGGWTNYAWYTKRYCKAYQEWYGRNNSGAAFTEELQRRIRSTFMIRRLKKDVLKELPAKVHSVINLSGGPNVLKQLAKERAVLKRMSEKVSTSKMEGDFRSMNREIMIAFTELSAVRQETALLKIKPGMELINDTVEADGKVIVFAHHKNVIRSLEDMCKHKFVTITGSTTKEARHRNVEQFQSNEDIKVFFGNLKAAGVGLTLTSASHVIFLELDWSPAWMAQAADRAHRIGQKDTVFIKYLVFDDSIDAKMANMLIDKQKVIASTVGEAESNEDTLKSLLNI